MSKKSWKTAETIPRFVLAAVRKGLKMADTIGIDEANDKTRLTIVFRRLPKPAPSGGSAVRPPETR